MWFQRNGRGQFDNGDMSTEFNTRKQAETKAICKAFEILENRLKGIDND